MPVMQPAEIWQESGRWDAIGGEMFRLKDRKGADMALAMTHEEVVTWLAAREIHSYKQLPQLWYHFQTKERDEARPKSGVLRTREFIMKDSYSLDVSEEALQESYRLHIGAYDRIYARCGLDFMMVEGDSGMMGGAISHEYMAYSDAGEDEIVFCRECGYASNVETAVAGADPEPPHSEIQTAVDESAESVIGDAAAHGAHRRCRRTDVRSQDDRPGRRFPRAPSPGVHEGAGRDGRRRRSGDRRPGCRGDRGRACRRAPGDGAPARRSRAERAQAAQGAGRRLPSRDRRRGRRRPRHRARIHRPGADGPACVRRRRAAPGLLRGRRQRGGPSPHRHLHGDGASGGLRRPAEGAGRRCLCAVLRASSRARAPSRSATSSSSASSTPCPWGRRSWTRTARSGPSSWAATASASRASPPPRWSSTTTTTASAGRRAIAPFHVHLVLVRASDETQRGLADDLYSQLSAGGRRGASTTTAT